MKSFELVQREDGKILSSRPMRLMYVERMVMPDGVQNGFERVKPGAMVCVLTDVDQHGEELT